MVVDTSVNPDGSGVLRSAIVYSPEELTNFVRSPGHEGRSICDAHRQDAPAGWTFLEEEYAEETYCIVERRFTGLNELAELYAGMNGVTVNRLGFALGRLTFDVEVERSSGEEGEAADEWRLTLPGSVESHNAHRTEGQTLVWEIGLGERENLRAFSRVGLSLRTLGPAGWLILLALLGLAGLGAGIAVALRRRVGDAGGTKGP